MSQDQEKQKLSELITSGSDIAGAAVGGALGFLAAGPVGAAAAAVGGTAVGKVIGRVGVELHDRFLGPREEKRVGATTAFAIEAIKGMLEEGKTPRQDGFFDEDESARSSADELFEGALIKSKSAYEEKKIRFIGAFFGSVAFTPELSPERANYYLNLVERLTYRQLRLLIILNRGREFGLRAEGLTNQRVNPEAWGLLQEINELHDLSLLRQLNEKRERDLFWGLGAIKPGKMELTRLGLDMIEYFELNKISEHELAQEVEMLR